MQDNITRTELLNNTLGNLSGSSLSREIKENGFPKPIKIGSMLYFKTSLINEWLSNKANRKISIDDRLLSSKQIEAIFIRSSAWVWTYQTNEEKGHLYSF